MASGRGHVRTFARLGENSRFPCEIYRSLIREPNDLVAVTNSKVRIPLNHLSSRRRDTEARKIASDYQNSWSRAACARKTAILKVYEKNLYKKRNARSYQIVSCTDDGFFEELALSSCELLDVFLGKILLGKYDV